MKRNSRTIFIESPGATTPLPWDGDAPDFTGFSEPTLSVLQTAYQNSIDSIEVVADPEPFIEVIEPDWDGLKVSNLAGSLAPIYQRLTLSAMSNGSVSTAQNQIMLAILYIKDEGALEAGISLLTQQAEYTFTEEEKSIWNTTVTELNFSSRVFI